MTKNKKALEHIAKHTTTFLKTERGYQLNAEITDPQVIKYLKELILK